MNLSLTPTSATHAMVYGISEDGLRFPWGQFAIEKNQLVSNEVDITDKTKRPVRKTYKRSRDAKWFAIGMSLTRFHRISYFGERGFHPFNAGG